MKNWDMSFGTNLIDFPERYKDIKHKTQNQNTNHDEEIARNLTLRVN